MLNEVKNFSLVFLCSELSQVLQLDQAGQSRFPNERIDIVAELLDDRVKPWIHLVNAHLKQGFQRVCTSKWLPNLGLFVNQVDRH